MALVTNNGHSRRAKAFYDLEDIYFAIGQQESWPDEDNPPSEELDEQISDVICYRKVEQKFFVVKCVEGETGQIEYRGEMYRIIDPDDIYIENCRWVLVMAWLNYDQCPINVQYRKIGLYTGVKPDPSLPEGQYTLIPSQGEVLDSGTLEIIVNDVVTRRTANKRERLVVLAEF